MVYYNWEASRISDGVQQQEEPIYEQYSTVAIGYEPKSSAARTADCLGSDIITTWVGIFVQSPPLASSNIMEKSYNLSKSVSSRFCIQLK